MKANRFIIFFILLLILAASESCIVLVPHDNGKHKGWSDDHTEHQHPDSGNSGHSEKSHK